MKENETARVEAFSDGVFAIAITLLVLNLHVPHVAEIAADSSLFRVLLDQWASFVAYIVSFFSILIMWINHHNMFNFIKKVDQPFLILNGLLLMGITIVPFPTALVAEHVQHPSQNQAAAVYGGLMFFIAMMYNSMWYYATRNQRLLDDNIDSRVVDGIRRQYLFGPLLYLTAFVLAFVNVYASLAIYLFLIIFFSFRSVDPSSLSREQFPPSKPPAGHNRT